MSIFGDIGSAIMTPLYYLTSAALVGWHWLWSHVFPETSGAAWALSIVGLTVVIRALLIPLFVKQIKSSRNMQLLQPRVKALQKKYGHDREKLAQETMALYKETGHEPVRLVHAADLADADLLRTVPPHRHRREERQGPRVPDRHHAPSSSRTPSCSASRSRRRS